MLMTAFDMLEMSVETTLIINLWKCYGDKRKNKWIEYVEEAHYSNYLKREVEQPTFEENNFGMCMGINWKSKESVK